MSSEQNKTIAELKRRLVAAESALNAIQKGEVDSILSDQGEMSVRLARAEARETYFQQVLSTIRKVNQLINRQTDPFLLADEACARLTDELGYISAWIALFDRDTQNVIHTAFSGYDSGTDRLSKQLRSNQYPSCIQKALKTEEPVILENVASQCKECPLAGEGIHHAAISHSLRHGNVVYGVINFSIPPKHINDSNTIALFSELACDLGNALHVIHTSRLRQLGQERLELALEGAGLGTWDWYIQTNDVVFDRRWAEMLGYSLDEIAPNLSSWESLTHPDDLAKAKKQLSLHFDGQSDYYECEIRMRHKDGHWVHIFDKGRVIERDSDGVPIRACGTHLDISQIKNLEEQLRQSQKLESVGRLAGGVAHDFNNMLSVILGHSELILDQLDTADSLHQSVNEIQKAAHRSANLTRQLLAFARKQSASPSAINLNETVESMMKMLQRLIGENIHLQWRPCRDLWTVYLDPSQVDQILTNICVNARDAIQNKGDIVVITENITLTHDLPIRGESIKPGEYVCLSIKDNGCGMDEETQNLIFEPFFTTKEVGQGTGLGLSTVFGIAKQHNGYIDLISRPNEGTTFALYFPRHETKTEKKKMLAQSPKHSGQGTVLLVEDETVVLEITQRMLKELGYKVMSFTNVDEAIEIAEKEPQIDLLVTDVIMPGLSGKEVAQNIKRHHPNMPVLFISGYTADTISQEGIMEEGIHFLQKPFNQISLSHKIREAMNAS